MKQKWKCDACAFRCRLTSSDGRPYHCVMFSAGFVEKVGLSRSRWVLRVKKNVR